MEFSMINISLKNGQNYGCSSVCTSRMGDKPSLSFISSGYAKTVLVEDIKEISLSTETWCPICK